MELAAGEPLFARLAYADPADYADTLEAAVDLMCDRRLRLRGITRLHQPTPAEPLIVIFIDELAAGTAAAGHVGDASRRGAGATVMTQNDRTSADRAAKIKVVLAAAHDA